MSEERQVWDSQFAFIMAMVGSAVGLANIWRYPYVAYSNGGGAFLLPYLISMLAMAIPFLILEYGLGYSFKCSIPSIFSKIKPKLEPVGWFIALISYLIVTYYVVVIAWAMIYFLLSFSLGWGSDPNHFFTTVLLRSTNSIAGIGDIVLPIFASMSVIWFFVWFISQKDLNDGLGKYNKILIPLLIAIMAVIVAVSLTLPGADVGYGTLFSIDLSSLTNPHVFLAAAAQILFSLGIGEGLIITYTSYLPEGVDIVKSGVTVAAINSSFELFTAVGVFSILGFMSFTQGVPLGDLLTGGSGMMFVVFPQVFNHMGILGYVLGPMFFLCILFAGITSALALIEPLSLSIAKKFGFNRRKVATLICGFGFLISIMFTTGAGNYILDIADTFLSNFALVFGIIIESLVFGWVYSLDDIRDVVNRNTRFKIGRWWVYLLKYIIPFAFLAIWIDGVYGFFTSSDLTAIAIEIIYAVVLIVVPFVFARKNSVGEDS